MKISEINMIFYDLVDHLYLHLSATEEFSFDLLNECEDINLSFIKRWLTNINVCKSLHLLKIYLLPFITWFDHSVLKELVTKCGSNYAQQLLDLFDSKLRLFCDQPIASFPIPPPSQLIIPLANSDFTLLAMNFHPHSQSTTKTGMILQDVQNIKVMLKEKLNISNHHVQLVAVHKTLKLLYWMIPKCLVGVVASNLVLNWESEIIMLTVLPANFCLVEDNSKILNGPFSQLNVLWQDDTEVDNPPCYILAICIYVIVN